MARLSSSKAHAKRNATRVDLADARIGLARSNDPATGEVKTYYLTLSPYDDEDTDSGRVFTVRLTPDEWAQMLKAWTRP